MSNHDDPAAQLADFRGQWESSCGTLPGRADESEDDLAAELRGVKRAALQMARRQRNGVPEANSNGHAAAIAAPVHRIGRISPDGSQTKLLLAAARGLVQPFGLTALILAAWRLAPEAFGLPGCESEHPDASRVRAALYGRRGVVRSGGIRRRADGLMEVAR